MSSSLILLLLFSFSSASIISQKIDVNYDRRLSPHSITSIPVNVSFSIEHLRYIQMSSRGSIHWLLTLRLTWSDERLRFSSKTFKDPFRFFIPSEQAWIPGISIVNGLDVHPMGDCISELDVRSNGIVTWRRNVVVETICDIDPIKVLETFHLTRFHWMNHSLNEGRIHFSKFELSVIYTFFFHFFSSSNVLSLLFSPILLTSLLIAAQHFHPEFTDEKNNSALLCSLFVLFFHFITIIYSTHITTTISYLVMFVLGEVLLVVISQCISSFLLHYFSVLSHSSPPSLLYSLTFMERRNIEEDRQTIMEKTFSSETNGNGYVRSNIGRIIEKGKEREWRKITYRLSFYIIVILESLHFTLLFVFLISTS